MSLIRVATNWFQRLKASKLPVGRDLQLRSETYLLYSFICGNPIPVVGLSDMLSYAAEQVISNSPETTFETQIDVVKKHLHHKIVQSLSLLKNHDCDEYTAGIRDRFGFVPRTLSSGIQGAGHGLYIDGKVQCGDLIALYPGLCYLPSDLTYLPNFPRITSDNEYLIWRYDGIVIDGKAAVQQRESSIRTKETYSHNLKTVFAEHPFSQGHMVNHPPPHGEPNCLQFMVNIPNTRNMSPIRPFVPNVVFEPSRRAVFDSLSNIGSKQRVPSLFAFESVTHSSSCIPTLALIATKEICDEEVFMNYRLHPAAPDVPAWYHDCDPASSKRRWSQVGVFSY